MRESTDSKIPSINEANNADAEEYGSEYEDDEQEEEEKDSTEAKLAAVKAKIALQ